MEEYFDDKIVIFLESADFDEAGKFRHDLRKRPLVVMMGGVFCPHCRNAAPEFNAFAKAAKANKSAVAAVIQVDKSEDESQLASRLGQLFPEVARGVPCFLLFGPNGVFIKTHEGARTQAAMEELVKEARK